jgi:hypothetical protein
LHAGKYDLTNRHRFGTPRSSPGWPPGSATIAALPSPSSHHNRTTPSGPLCHEPKSRLAMGFGLFRTNYSPRSDNPRCSAGRGPSGQLNFCLVLSQRHVVDGGLAPAHQTRLIEFPLFISMASKPVSPVVSAPKLSPFLGTSNDQLSAIATKCCACPGAVYPSPHRTRTRSDPHARTEADAAFTSRT